VSPERELRIGSDRAFEAWMSSDVGPGFTHPIVERRPADHEKEMSVPKVTYVYDDGSERTVEVAVAMSLMRAALRNQVRGIVGECGGSATCGTCHVYLDHSTEQFAPPSGDEDEMLEWTAAPRAGNSRLSRQPVPTEDGAQLVVRVPAEQV
jgi:2Fe-2S ferredoxin